MRKSFIVGGIILIAVIAAGLWIRHDAGVKAKNYYASKQTQQRTYTEQINTLNVSPLVKKEDADVLDRQRAICTNATKLSGTLGAVKPGASLLGLGSLANAEYKKALNDADIYAKQQKKAQDLVNKYAAVCDYYVTDNEYNAKYLQVGKSPEYQALLTHDGAACQISGCILPENYAAFAPIYDKKVAILKAHNETFAHKACPFDTPDTRAVCDQMKKSFDVYLQNDQDYVAALRASDRNKIRELTAPTSARYAASKALNDAFRKADPSVTTGEEIATFFAHQLAALEKQLQTSTI